LEHTSAMNFVLWPAVALFGVLGLVFVALFRNVGSRSRTSAMPADWDSIFSPSRYKPMERLLDPTDYRFLESQPAFNRKMARRVRSNRINMFRGYARCLARDYSRVSAAVRILMVHAPVDRSALAGPSVVLTLIASSSAADKGASHIANLAGAPVVGHQLFLPHPKDLRGGSMSQNPSRAFGGVMGISRQLSVRLPTANAKQGT
jgi:hypothetical protein